MEPKFIDRVYETLVQDVVEIYRVPGVDPLFEVGQPCLALYSQALDAYQNLCRRLGKTDEDEDVETIFHAFLQMEKEIGYRMYEYGARFGMDGERFSGILVNYYPG